MFAVVLILLRRRNGPMSSSGETPGANTTLSIDDPVASREPDDQRLPPARVQDVTA